MSKIRLGVIYGGRSGEHEVSLRSARSIVDALDPGKYDLVLIGIDPNGVWHRHSEAEFRQLTGPSGAQVDDRGIEVTLPAAPRDGALWPRSPSSGDIEMRLDVVFPALHGTFGEDGTVQGLLELADVPYVGPGVLGSAVGMDKDVQKRLLREAGIPIVDFFAVRRWEWDANPESVSAAATGLGFPLFVKPANLGSSVGVSRVADAGALRSAIDDAFLYDDKIVVECGVDAREIECSVLGNEHPEVSLPGEVCPTEDFYSYEAKYIDENGATFVIPAQLGPTLTEVVRDLALRAYKVIECEGMARVDLFLERGTDRLYVNELNTIPGFTAISQYPKLWEATGLPYPALLDRLIDLALERYRRRKRLRRHYESRQP